jgi:predicted dehydrogenase
LGRVLLYGAKLNNKLTPLPVPERFVMAAPGTSGEPSNVGQMYALFAQAIRDGKSHQPTFETAVDLHRLIDAARQSSDSGCEVKFGQPPH